MTRSIKQSRTCAPIQSGTAGPSVTQYATVAELITASQGGLAPGYYEVPGVWITFWNGSTFSPDAPGSVSGDLSTIVPAAIAAESNAVLCLAPQSKFPGLRDYTDTIPDTDLCTATTLRDRAQRGLLNGFLRKVGQFGSQPHLRILGDVVVRAMIRVLAPISTQLNLIDYGTPSGSGEARNTIINANTSASQIDWYSETGSRVSGQAFWAVPGRLQSDREYVLEWRRESDVVTAWINGLKLRLIQSVTGNAVNSGDGDATFPTPTGGTDAELCFAGFADDASVDVYFGAIYDAVVQPASDFADGKAAFTQEELNWIVPSDANDIGGQADVVLCLEAVDDGLKDYAGTIDYTTDWSTSGVVAPAIDTAVYTRGTNASGTQWIANYKADLDLLGSMSIRARYLCKANSSAGYKVDTSTAGNHAHLFVVEGSSNQVRYFHRSAGSNRDVAWTIDPLSQNEVREWHVKRTLSGGNVTLECWERKYPGTVWTKLTVKSTTGGSGVGTDIGTLPAPSSSGTRLLQIFDYDPLIRLVIYNAAIDP